MDTASASPNPANPCTLRRWNAPRPMLAAKASFTTKLAGNRAERAERYATHAHATVDAHDDERRLHGLSGLEYVPGHGALRNADVDAHGRIRPVGDEALHIRFDVLAR